MPFRWISSKVAAGSQTQQTSSTNVGMIDQLDPPTVATALTHTAILAPLEPDIVHTHGTEAVQRADAAAHASPWLSREPRQPPAPNLSNFLNPNNMYHNHALAELYHNMSKPEKDELWMMDMLLRQAGNHAAVNSSQPTTAAASRALAALKAATATVVAAAADSTNRSTGLETDCAASRNSFLPPTPARTTPQSDPCPKTVPPMYTQGCNTQYPSPANPSPSVAPKARRSSAVSTTIPSACGYAVQWHGAPLRNQISVSGSNTDTSVSTSSMGVSNEQLLAAALNTGSSCNSNSCSGTLPLENFVSSLPGMAGPQSLDFMPMLNSAGSFCPATTAISNAPIPNLGSEAGLPADIPLTTANLHTWAAVMMQLSDMLPAPVRASTLELVDAVLASTQPPMDPHDLPHMQLPLDMPHMQLPLSPPEAVPRAACMVQGTATCRPRSSISLPGGHAACLPHPTSTARPQQALFADPMPASGAIPRQPTGSTMAAPRMAAAAQQAAGGISARSQLVLMSGATAAPQDPYYMHQAYGLQESLPGHSLQSQPQHAMQQQLPAGMRLLNLQ